MYISLVHVGRAWWTIYLVKFECLALRKYVALLELEKAKSFLNYWMKRIGRYGRKLRWTFVMDKSYFERYEVIPTKQMKVFA